MPSEIKRQVLDAARAARLVESMIADFLTRSPEHPLIGPLVELQHKMRQKARPVYEYERKRAAQEASL